ncbi:gastrula zinc finger protein XlCGF57.1-like [Cheilinus undulatus]|uniref:gastrula zinc finger protein XlCGF57.1-like n=1 Tax=Cheilinus undulatus TaxID=241271 RepID=UPI001BD27BDB|nr:gastrula zinc finger protein XlCGF57.1-like [Cheilinus undulatus]XP_041664432.1 gastrula zinc finger protein XlCGF57.1-like [Cheilinus undulatus]
MSGFQDVSVLPTDVQKPLVNKEEPSELQGWSPSLDLEDTKPSHIKEEQEEVWISEDGKHLQGQEEPNNKFPFSLVLEKTEDDEEKPQPSQLHQIKTEQMETEANEEDFGESEQARSSDPESHLHPEIEVKIEDSSEPDAEDSDHMKCPTMYHLGLDSMERVKDQGPKTDDKLHCCSECGKIFKNEVNLTGHMRIHTRKKPLDYAKGGGSSSIEVNLPQHISHMVEKSFSCTECGKRYSHKSRLTYHLRSHTGEKPFSCPECGKQFRCKRNLTEHLRIHTGEIPFSCSVCGKGFIRKENLTQHMFIHTREKSFGCSECGKKFRLKGHLRQHVKIHVIEKTFSCSECGKCFNCKEYLTQHMRIHTGEKPLSCFECGKRFAWIGCLKKHMITHAGVKPFSCSECTKSFKDKETLNKHMRVHTGEKPLSCISCGQKFSWHAQLKRHKCVDGHSSEQLKGLPELKRRTETGANKEDCGGSEGARFSNTGRDLQPEIEVMLEDFSEPETEDFHDDSLRTRDRLSFSQGKIRKFQS